MWSFLKTWTPKVLLAISVALLLLQLGSAVRLFVERNWALISFPYPVDYGEGPILDQTMSLSRLENVYRRDLSQPPYTITNYPPLYPLLQVPFAWAFGPALWYGRLLSVLSVLAAALFLGLALRTMTGDWLGGAVSALCLLASPYVLYWSGFNRVDSLALGLSCAGLWVLVRWGNRDAERVGTNGSPLCAVSAYLRTRRGLVAGALLLVGAAYTRQSYGLAAPFAAFVWLLRARPRRRAFELAAWVAGMGLVLFALLNLSTQGGFALHTVAANVNPFYWRTVEHFAKEMWAHMPYLLVSSGLFLLVAVWLRQRSWWLVAPYLVGAALSALTVGKAGSSLNYFYEFSAALSLAAGALIAWPGRRLWLRIPLVLLLFVQLGAVVAWAGEDHARRDMWKIDRRDEVERLAQIVAGVEGPVLSDEFMALVPLAGKELPFQPFEFKQLHEAGIWDQRPLVGALADGEYAVVLLFDPPYWDSQRERWTPDLLNAIAIGYVPAQRLANTIVYRPR